MTKALSILLFLFFCVFGILFFNDISSNTNYEMHKRIKFELVKHPEFIPSKNLVKIGSSGFNNLVSDFYWLDSIQYIGSNARDSQYKKYLYSMLNLVTDLNPNFTYPYVIGELLLPSFNERYEGYQEKDKDTFTVQSLNLGLKGMEYNCKKDKLEAIKNETDLKKIWSTEKYENPCSEPLIPYYLAYIYYWNKFDGATSSDYYKVASANKDGPTGSRMMAAIMQGKSGNREKAILMFLSLAESVSNEKNKQCKDFSKQLGGFLYQVFQDKKMFNSKFLIDVDKVRSEVINKLGEIDDGAIASETQCSSYLNKSVRELNLAFLEHADDQFYTKNKRHAVNSKELLESKTIDYIPVDYQNSKEMPMMYFYNKDTNHWDTKEVVGE